jgi:hypothetical protein
MAKRIGNRAPITGRSIRAVDDPCGCDMTKSKSKEVPATSAERRATPRRTQLSNHRAEFKFRGVPAYQLKVRDLSEKGAGIVVKVGSDFLALIQIGQEVSMKLLSPADAASPAGNYLSRIQHVSELERGRFKGHLVVGLSMLKRLSAY